MLMATIISKENHVHTYNNNQPRPKTLYYSGDFTFEDVIGGRLPEGSSLEEDVNGDSVEEYDPAHRG